MLDLIQESIQVEARFGAQLGVQLEFERESATWQRFCSEIPPALVSAMASKNYIDRILKLLLPTFKTDRAGGASDKTNLLGAFNLLPRHLITAAELLNKTRNQFAHNLMLSSLAQLDQHKPALIHDMRSICRTRQIDVVAGNNETKELFEVMFRMATTGIHYYEENGGFIQNSLAPCRLSKLLERCRRQR